MIPVDLRKQGYLVFWKNTKRSGIPAKAVGSISKPIPGTKDKYSHVGEIDKDTGYLIHSRPPRVIRERMDSDFWARNDRHELQLWRVKDSDVVIDICGKVQTRREHMVDFFYLNNFLHDKNGQLIEKYNKHGELIGKKYDYKAIWTFAMGQNKFRVHCAETIFFSVLPTGIILSPDGIYDRVVSPQELLSSGYLERLY